MKNNRQIVNVEQAAELLGVSQSMIHKLCDENKLNYYKLTEGMTAPLRIYIDSVKEYALRVQGRRV